MLQGKRVICLHAVHVRTETNNCTGRLTRSSHSSAVFGFLFLFLFVAAGVAVAVAVPNPSPAPPPWGPARATVLPHWLVPCSPVQLWILPRCSRIPRSSDIHLDTIPYTHPHSERWSPPLLLSRCAWPSESRGEMGAGNDRNRRVVGLWPAMAMAMAEASRHGVRGAFVSVSLSYQIGRAESLMSGQPNSDGAVSFFVCAYMPGQDAVCTTASACSFFCAGAFATSSTRVPFDDGTSSLACLATQRGTVVHREARKML
ncbi:hypothetical protein B0T22DRAFT_454974 [Podospora appendiculata]|uniref:Uncharacterized protein n=1 Tax=Podospora appendiculata TaxID=314037 RepID=A0AAE1CI84_9PEZI|nr:hypothetical protein B0T22DRAFT_454974 [Podospora appendiculata]